MTFKNITTLSKHIEKQLQDTMTNEVSNAVTDNMSEAVQTSVYDAYSPEYYNRRMQNGGLIDRGNMEITKIENGIAVHDTAPYDLDEIIVYGLGNQPFERDFYSETEKRLSENQDHIKALKQSFKKRGIKVE